MQGIHSAQSELGPSLARPFSHVTLGQFLLCSLSFSLPTHEIWLINSIGRTSDHRENQVLKHLGPFGKSPRKK